ncbi:DUF1931 domain-containing protein [archaeon]|nr:DUF1931 domain-containing protein [archaeon]
MADVLAVESRVKEFAKTIDNEGKNVSSDFVETLSKKIEQIIKDAVARAKSNDRKTVRAGDI